MSPDRGPASGVLIRPGASSDSDAIDQIERASFLHAGERFGLRRIRYLLTTPRAMVSVAETQGQVIGWVAGMTGKGKQGPWGRVYALAIHPRGRGRKLGPRLLNHIITILRERSASPIFLEVRSDNHPAIQLYRRNGFTACHALPNYYGQGVDGIRMALTGQQQAESESPI